MARRRTTTIQQLRLAIDCLPRDTRVAMLEGIRTNEIIVGAYTHRDGVCPMLAAHRAGGRTNFISFAKAWDRFAFAGSRHQSARRATEHELLVLQSHLEASLLEDELPEADLAAAIAEHRELTSRRPSRRDTRPGDRDRTRELRTRPGWAWLRVMRRYDEYELALRRVQDEAARTERERVQDEAARTVGERQHAGV
jgi:hypothetical protein